MAKKPRQRATSITNFQNIVVPCFEFTGEWLLAFGKPDRGGLWYIGGQPTSGKTSFMVQLMKMFCEMDERVRFYNFEERVSGALQEAFDRVNMTEEAGKIQIVSWKMSYKEVVEEIKSTRTTVVVIDTVQKSGFSKSEIEDIRDTFPNVTIIFCCHVLPNGLPDKAPAKQVHRDADQKILCDRYRAICQGRSFGERGYYNIWKEKADECWAVVE